MDDKILKLLGQKSYTPSNVPQLLDSLGLRPNQQQELQQAISRLTRDGREALAVVDEQGHYRGVITARRLDETLEAGDVGAEVGQLAEEVPTVTDDQNLEEAVRALSRTDGSGLPVLTADGSRPIGWLTHRDVLRTYNRHRAVPHAKRPAGRKGPDG